MPWIPALPTSPETSHSSSHPLLLSCVIILHRFWIFLKSISASFCLSVFKIGNSTNSLWNPFSPSSFSPVFQICLLNFFFKWKRDPHCWLTTLSHHTQSVPSLSFFQCLVGVLQPFRGSFDTSAHLSLLEPSWSPAAMATLWLSTHLSSLPLPSFTLVFP